MPPFDVIAFDADDTLWHNERIYAGVQASFARLLSPYHPKEVVEARLYQTETRNIKSFGYGIKSFTLSMIETAVELTEGTISSKEIQAIIDLGKGMLGAEVELLEHTDGTIAQLAASYRLMVITKGDLQDQQTKIARSGLGQYFQYIEVVNDKTRDIYSQLLRKLSIQPERFLMVGDSLRSDILPILELGGQAVYIPYQITWLHESAEIPPQDTPGFHQIENLGRLPGLLEQLAAG
ncbi:MAG TPA: HAD family hydrolase [Anaerolineales bacterium]